VWIYDIDLFLYDLKVHIYSPNYVLGTYLKSYYVLHVHIYTYDFENSKSYLTHMKFHEIFLYYYVTNKLYALPLGTFRHDSTHNMRAELPVFRLEHTKLWWRKHTAHFGQNFART